jgi:hypothetical protein
VQWGKGRKKEKSQRKGKWPISGLFGGRFIFTIPF